MALGFMLRILIINTTDCVCIRGQLILSWAIGLEDSLQVPQFVLVDLFDDIHVVEELCVHTYHGCVDDAVSL